MLGKLVRYAMLRTHCLLNKFVRKKCVSFLSINIEINPFAEKTGTYSFQILKQSSIENQLLCKYIRKAIGAGFFLLIAFEIYSRIEYTRCRARVKYRPFRSRIK